MILMSAHYDITCFKINGECNKKHADAKLAMPNARREIKQLHNNQRHSNHI